SPAPAVSNGEPAVKTDQERAVSLAVIALMKGVVYRESHEEAWSTLEHRSAPVRDHFATIGIDVVIDATEGYAYLRSAPDTDEDALPRLVQRSEERRVGKG